MLRFINKFITRIYHTLFAWYLHWVAFLVRKRPFPEVLTSEETIDFIVKNCSSVSRFGDGELKLMSGYKSLNFQKRNKRLKKELKAVASSSLENCLVCVPKVFDQSLNKERYIDETVIFWNNRTAYAPFDYYWKTTFTNDFYGDALLSRFYITLRDKSGAPSYVKSLKRIWQDRDIVFVEGTLSRLGVGNDLFINAHSIHRILAPVANAYDKIDEMENYIKKNINKETLLLLALGPTATVLAWRLAKVGYQAIDIGHVDIEYEWMLMGATTKVPIKNKFVNEVGDGRTGRVIENVHENTYNEQIIKRFDKDSEAVRQ